MPGQVHAPVAQAVAFTLLNPHVYLATLLLVGVTLVVLAALLVRHALAGA